MPYCGRNLNSILINFEDSGFGTEEKEPLPPAEGAFYQGTWLAAKTESWISAPATQLCRTALLALYFHMLVF